MGMQVKFVLRGNICNNVLNAQRVSIWYHNTPRDIIYIVVMFCLKTWKIVDLFPSKLLMNLQDTRYEIKNKKNNKKTLRLSRMKLYMIFFWFEVVGLFPLPIFHNPINAAVLFFPIQEYMKRNWYNGHICLLIWLRRFKRSSIWKTLPVRFCSAQRPQ